MKLSIGVIGVSILLSGALAGAVYVMGEIVLFLARVMMNIGNLIW
ncbi:hypothetical protein VIPECLOM01_00298 [Enterobacter phage vB_VIPECLOM01]|uniref:Uncharacterized protein n=2 Tax=Karamvirus pg7 TaxID=1913655 RepID=A0A5B9NP92_9CAUD|nr:hypothetical protein CG98_gp156 [Enterobacter phage PG7]AHI61189.1 hypothetical protein PG7_286 [Enterobacter phage PG7]QEG13331.1 hypothetical protein KAALPHA_313 [Klebsiella phage vB_KaeM_KaAlpha]WFG78712.1 hypothetical protein VIPECLOM01_00298 [Enterobacter phage vB_VIPECLOM01]WFG78999.1 hypothetical protein VIPECLUMC02_00297 [Enterobacter phage vB_VIPECLUMC02]